MNEKNDHNKSDVRDQTNRPKRMRLQDPTASSIDALNSNAKQQSNMEKLSTNCLRHIFSFLTYDKLCEMRRVSKRFNKFGKYFLHHGYRELEKRLKGELERMDQRVLFQTNIRSSNDMLRFLTGLREAIDDCAITYQFQVNYFIAGKLLDQVNHLLNDFNSSTVIPYLQEHVYDEMPLHPLLAAISAHSEKAHRHFDYKILEKFIYYDKKARDKRVDQIYSDSDLVFSRHETRIAKINLLKRLRQKISCGIEMNGELLKLILKLNKYVLDLTQFAKIVDDESIVSTNPLGQSVHSFQQPSSCPPLRETKGMEISRSKRRPYNLAMLPSSCIQEIVSYFNCDKIAQLRLVCKPFNRACEIKLNREYEKVKREFEVKIEQGERVSSMCVMRVASFRVDLMTDLCNILQLCEDGYKWHLGSDYFFVAGKVLDEAKRLLCNELKPIIIWTFNGDSSDDPRPHFCLHYLMDLAYQAIAHFKFNIVPKYFTLTQNRIYIPNFIITRDGMNLKNESQLNWEEIEKLIEKADVKIEKLNDRNRKLVKIISSLKKKVIDFE